MWSAALTGDAFRPHMLEDRPVDPVNHEQAVARNMAAPIHQLPEDILLRIFHLVKQGPSSLAGLVRSDDWTRIAEYDIGGWLPAHRGWPAVMGVCKYWRMLIWNAPLLWSTIFVRGNVEWLELALARSSSAPVDMVLLRPDIIQFALPVLSPHTHRIRLLQFTNVKEENAQFIAPFLLKTALPKLEELRIQGFSGLVPSHMDEDRVVLELDKGLLPSLHTLRLSNALVPLDCAAVSALRVLDLSHVSLHAYMAALSLDDLLNALERIKSLEALSFDWGLPYRWSLERSNRMVALPGLRSLRIISPTDYENSSSPDEEVLMTFLRHLHIPLGANIRITACVDGEPEGYNFLKLIPQDPDCLPILRCATSATLGKVWFRCSADTGGSLEVELDDAYPGLEPNPQDKLLEEFCVLLSHAPLTKLAIASHTLSQEALVLALCQFTAVSDLEFAIPPGASNVAIDSLVSALSVTDVPSDVSVPLPRLRSLRVVGARGLLTETTRVEGLESLTSARAERGAKLDKLDIEEKTVRPVPYSMLDVLGDDDAYIGYDLDDDDDFGDLLPHDEYATNDEEFEEW